MADLETLLTYLTLISVPIGVFYHIMTLENTRKNQKVQLETRQAQLYMNVYNSHFSKENQKDVIEMMRWSVRNYNEMEDAHGAKGWTQLMSYMSQLEGLSFLVKNGFLDVNLIYDIQYASIIGLWEKFLPITIEARDRWSMPQLWIEVEHLYDEMVRIRDEKGHEVFDLTPSIPKTEILAPTPHRFDYCSCH